MRNAAEVLAALYGVSAAANEEFTEIGNRAGGLTCPQSGWDPYEVWQTRFKAAPTAVRKRERGDCMPRSVPPA
jgi:hypothetical protein